MQSSFPVIWVTPATSSSTSVDFPEAGGPTTAISARLRPLNLRSISDASSLGSRACTTSHPPARRKVCRWHRCRKSLTQPHMDSPPGLGKSVSAGPGNLGESSERSRSHSLPSVTPRPRTAKPDYFPDIKPPQRRDSLPLSPKALCVKASSQNRRSGCTGTTLAALTRR